MRVALSGTRLLWAASSVENAEAYRDDALDANPYGT